MRQRAIATTKILAIAFVTTAGCTKPEVLAEHPAVSAPAVASSAPATVSSAGGGDAAVEDPKLIALRTELENGSPAEAVAKTAHYRPLCDKDGYPLVGNLARKSPEPGLEPSQFCADIRTKLTKP